MSAEIGRSELELAVEKQAGDLQDAQRELVLSQFGTYMWNLGRMRDIEAELEGLDIDVEQDPKVFRNKLALKKTLTVERNQLATANNSISSKLFMQLRGTGGDEDEFDQFLNGGGIGQ